MTASSLDRSFAPATAGSDVLSTALVTLEVSGSNSLPRLTAAGEIDWAFSIDSTINRAHQHATTLPRATGGPGESHESAHGAG